MEQLISVLLGIGVGTVTGVVPGIGIMIAMVICTPILMNFDIVSLLLFYMSVASMVQFTGTVPAVYLGVPGEANSLPAVIEGHKHAKHGLGRLAIGYSALGSVLGSMMAVLITWFALTILADNLTFFFSNPVKLAIYSLVILFCLTVYNRSNLLVNILLCLLGFALSLPGESNIHTGFRFWFGIQDLKYGIPLLPILIGFIVVPNLTKITSLPRHSFLAEKNVSLLGVIQKFSHKITSAIRGSIIGFFAGLVPGVTTVLATNSSYGLEKKLHPTSSSRQLIAAETANNSGQFSSMLPLLLIGIPITGSEVVLYSLLIDAGWSPFQFNNVQNNISMIFTQIVPWFVFVNICGLLIAWPFSKFVLNILKINKQAIVFGLITILIVLTWYVGILDYRPFAYLMYLTVFSISGIILKRYELVPLIFMFILGNHIEAVVYRQFLI